MRLTPGELAKLLGILEKIDRGLIRPRAPDRIGRFLRQYAGGRAQLDEVFARQGVERRADSALSGRTLGAIELHPILEPDISLLGFPLGEVAETMAISEELGGLVNLVMWLKGPTANAAYNLLRTNRSGLQLSGDYRWTPPSRLTPGEASLETSDRPIHWRHARCLKAVADDVVRPPHALEYVLDYRMGSAGLKYFRCVCVLKQVEQWQVLPGLSRPRPLEVAQGHPGSASALHLGDGELATLLIYREPWSRAWTIVDAAAIEAEDALAHSIAWADFQRELDGLEIDASIMGGVREALRRSGVRFSNSGEPNLARTLVPVARDVIRWLRGAG